MYKLGYVAGNEGKQESNSKSSKRNHDKADYTIEEISSDEVFAANFRKSEEHSVDHLQISEKKEREIGRKERKDKWIFVGPLKHTSNIGKGLQQKRHH